ncbi:hypothetical protein C8J56DRAFT_1162426 [Mycena floridula]|nr:hypothetical protein C8J56DRAFT_1162426 [Mycena floridula]
MKFFATSFLVAAIAATCVSAGLVKRIDNRIPVDIPEGLTREEFCLEWTGACLATIAIQAPGATASIFCFDAPTPGQANVFCTSTPTTRFTDAVIAALKTPRVSSP